MDPITFSIIPPPPLPRHRRGGDHAEARLRQRDHQRGPRPHGLPLPRRRLAAHGGVGFLHHLTSAAEACKAVIRRFEGDIGEGDVFPHQLPLHGGAAYLGHLPGGPDPPRRPAGGVERLLRPRLRHRRHGAGRLQPGFARYLHRGVLVARHQAGRRRDHAPRRDGHAAQHGPRAGDGGARPLLHDRGQQRGAGAHGGADREVWRGPGGRGLRRAGRSVGDPLPQAPPRAARRALGGAAVLRHRGRDLPRPAHDDQGRRRTHVRFHRLQPAVPLRHQLHLLGLLGRLLRPPLPAALLRHHLERRRSQADQDDRAGRHDRELHAPRAGLAGDRGHDPVGEQRRLHLHRQDAVGEREIRQGGHGGLATAATSPSSCSASTSAGRRPSAS